ncbi:MAG: transcription termination/antitermination protein NusG [Deltaproteobacteria bacterium]|nr:transcription termination/antitermination protein NusG [Deltaproteobacteria bacterium]MBT6434050.1 transcription termination/antitermination protein NusG [Deltaproteobacteria bacterium]MBT6488848.1 transcription termination/antitermination protein NusG [Deltaproteobacteria bacterium]
MTTQEQQDVQAPEEAPVAATEAEDTVEVTEAAEPGETVEAAEVATETAEGEATEGEGEAEVEEPEVNPNFRWYVVHTYSGYENRAKASLEERIKQQSLEAEFGEVLIPTENVVELGKGGTKRTSKRKFFPGYMLVQMELTDASWHLINDTPKITGFVGNATKPPPVPEEQVKRLTKQIDEGTLKAKPRVKFEEGEDVRVVDGPFANFNGIVETVNEDKGKVRVMVSIFGRSTPVELEFVQVEKA